MFTEGFPQRLEADMLSVCRRIFSDGIDFLDTAVTPERSVWQVAEGERIKIPYRIYLTDVDAGFCKNLSAVQETIFHCIFSRSHDGYVREKHIDALLKLGPPEWAIPYVVKVCDEYVVEILELVYRRLSGTDTSAYRAVCRRNLPRFVYSHCRMVSYWNEFYRDRCYHFHDYVGKALYEQCFGYTRSMDRAVRASDGLRDFKP